MRGMSFFVAWTMRVSPDLLFIGALSDWQNRVSMPSFAHESDIYPSIRAVAGWRCVRVAFPTSRGDSRWAGPIGRRPPCYRSKARSCRRLLRSWLDAARDGALAGEGSHSGAAQRMERAGNSGGREKL